MQNSRLYTLILTLSKKESRLLKDFVASPFFNKRADVCRLLAYLLECQQRLNIAPDKKKAFKKAFPKTDFNDAKLRITMNSLLRLVEQFLIYQDFAAEDIPAQIRLAKIYRYRNLPKHFERTIKNLEDSQQKQPFRNSSFYTHNYEIQLEKYQFASLKQRVGELNLQEISDNVDYAFLTLKLKQTCFILSHQRVYKTTYHIGLLEEVIAYIENQDILKIPAIAVYYYCYHLLTFPEEEMYFQKFKQLLVEHIEKFPPQEMRDLYLLGINHCIKKINGGEKAYFQECLDLYEIALAKNYLLENGTLSRFTFNNIVALGLQQENLKWVEQFIEQYEHFLEKKYRESIVLFNKARLEYQRQNYNIALPLLQQVNLKDLLNNLIAKTIQLKIYYETEEWTVLEAHLDSMRTFINRKKVMGYHRENYLNIIRYAKKLITLNPFDKTEVLQLQALIEQETVLTEKGWFLRQLTI